MSTFYKSRRVLPAENPENQRSYNVDYVNLRCYPLDLTTANHSQTAISCVVGKREQLDDCVKLHQTNSVDTRES